MPQAFTKAENLSTFPLPYCHEMLKFAERLISMYET
jgi:hypothetical protein